MDQPGLRNILNLIRDGLKVSLAFSYCRMLSAFGQTTLRSLQSFLIKTLAQFLGKVMPVNQLLITNKPSVPFKYLLHPSKKRPMIVDEQRKQSKNQSTSLLKTPRIRGLDQLKGVVQLQLVCVSSSPMPLGELRETNTDTSWFYCLYMRGCVNEVLQQFLLVIKSRTHIPNYGREICKLLLRNTIINRYEF